VSNIKANSLSSKPSTTRRLKLEKRTNLSLHGIIIYPVSFRNYKYIYFLFKNAISPFVLRIVNCNGIHEEEEGERER